METTRGQAATADVTLVFPPYSFSSINSPHLAIGQLAAYLTREGARVATWDGNVRFVRWLMHPEQVQHELTAARKGLDALNRRSSLSRNEYEELDRLARLGGITTAEIFSHDAIESDFAGPWPTVMNLLYGHRLGRIDNEIEQIIESLQRPDDHILKEFLVRESQFLDSLAGSAVVGINVSFSVQMQAALLLAQRIREKAGAAAPICVLGGTQISLLAPSQLARLSTLPFIHGVVIYEGEKPLAELLRAVQSARGLDPGVRADELDLSSIPNLWFKGKPPRRLANPVEPRGLPTPHYDPAELALYYERRYLPVYVTRGCYWGKCTFCDYTKLYTPDTRRWVERDPERVVQDVKTLVATHGVTSYRLISEAVPPRWYRQFAHLIIENGVRVRFWSYLKNERASVLKQEFFDLIRRAGVEDVTCGVESTEDRVLAVIDKGTTKADIEDNFRKMAVAGIRATCNLIPDYPTTRFDESQATIRFVYENIDYIPRLNHQFFDLSIQSAVAGSPETYEITMDAKRFVNSNHGCHSLTFTHKTLTAEQHALLKRAYDSLKLDVKRYHLTKHVLRAIEHPGFRWEESTFLFSDVHFIKTRYPLDRLWAESTVLPDELKQEDRDRLYVTGCRLAAEMLLPVELEGLLALVRDRRVVTFDAAVRACDVEHQQLGREAVTQGVKALILDMARLGFVEKVFGGLKPAMPSDVRRMLAVS